MNTLKIYGGIAVLGAAAYGTSMADRSMNYSPVQATVKTVSTDCYIESGNKKIVERENEQLAYMDCAMAPMVAEMNDMSETAIKYRSKVTFSYKSPVDGRLHLGEHTDRRSPRGGYKRNQKIDVYAHNETADQYRWN